LEYSPSPLFISAQAGAGGQEWRERATADRRLALDGPPRLCYLRQGGGDIPLSRSRPMIGAGGGVGLTQYQAPTSGQIVQKCKQQRKDIFYL